MIIPEKKIKILIRGVNWIGDAIMILPTLNAIKKKYNDSLITLVVKKWVKDIYKNNPDIDELIEYPENRKEYFNLIKKLRIVKYDIGLAMPKSFSAALFLFLAGAKKRIGFKSQFRSFLLTDRLKFTDELLNKHQLFIYLELARYIGCETIAPELNLVINENAIDKANDILKGDNWIGIHSGAFFGPAKRWLPENFAEVANRLMNNGFKIVWFGAASDTKTMELIKPLLKIETLDLTGKTSLDLLCALIKKCKVVIANDSGPMHIAAAVNTPVVAIFGSTNIKTTYPFTNNKIILYKKIECSPCMRRDCFKKTYDCFKQITVEDVYESVIKFVAN